MGYWPRTKKLISFDNCIWAILFWTMTSRAGSISMHGLLKLAAETARLPRHLCLSSDASIPAPETWWARAHPSFLPTLRPSPTKPLGIHFCRWLVDFMQMNKKERNFWCVGIPGLSDKPLRKKLAPGLWGPGGPRVVRNGRCVVETTKAWARDGHHVACMMI